ncbi:MAG: hypothetical protein LBQ90_09090 [Synergistaceae bacterium]|nr:hypothetical protein [Synergistaceae bacterium]
MRQGGTPFLRRRAVVLPSVLVVILMVSLILVGIFEFAVSSKKLTTVRGDRYSDQILVSGYIEQAKGTLIHTMKTTGAAVHPSLGGADWKSRPPLSTVDDLLVGGPAVNMEVTAGGRKLLLNVFDLTYDESQLANANATANILHDPEELRRLPPALDLTSRQKGSEGGMSNAGSTEGARDIEDSDDGSAGSAIDLRYFGAYLIRAEVFMSPDLPPHDSRRVRLTEEAFFQVLPSP